MSLDATFHTCCHTSLPGELSMSYLEDSKHVFTGRGAKEAYAWYFQTSPMCPFTLLIALWVLSL